MKNQTTLMTAEQKQQHFDEWMVRFAQCFLGATVTGVGLDLARFNTCYSSMMLIELNWMPLIGVALMVIAFVIPLPKRE